MVGGFCEDCQDLIDDWPYYGDIEDECSSPDKVTLHNDAFWKHKIVRDCHTLAMEAAGRKVCKMCAFLSQMLKEREAFQTFRRVEPRLECLHVGHVTSFTVQN